MNPLFVDSTKPIGDKVVTNVELMHILLHDGDALFFEMSDEFDFVQRFTMKKIETKKSVKYVTEVWLKYQHQIRYRFLIVAQGEEVFTSRTQQTHAGHVIAERWEPFFDQKLSQKKEQQKKELIKKERVRSAPAASLPPPEIKVRPRKSFASPPLLEQIRSLINELK